MLFVPKYAEREVARFAQVTPEITQNLLLDNFHFLGPTESIHSASELARNTIAAGLANVDSPDALELQIYKRAFEFVDLQLRKINLGARFAVGPLRGEYCALFHDKDEYRGLALPTQRAFALNRSLGLDLDTAVSVAVHEFTHLSGAVYYSSNGLAKAGLTVEAAVHKKRYFKLLEEFLCVSMQARYLRSIGYQEIRCQRPGELKVGVLDKDTCQACALLYDVYSEDPVSNFVDWNTVDLREALSIADMALSERSPRFNIPYTFWRKEGREVYSGYSEAYTALLRYAGEIYPHFHFIGRRTTLENSLLIFHHASDVQAACNLFKDSGGNAMVQMLAHVNPLFNSGRVKDIVNILLLRAFVDAIRLPPLERDYVRKNISDLVRRDPDYGFVLPLE